MKALSGIKVVAMLDRAISFGAVGGPIYMELRSALFDEPVKPKIINRIYGLGGKNINTEHVIDVYDDLFKLLAGKPVEQFGYINVRGT